MKKLTNPVIIIGMHRSGTTMLTKMLQELGLFIGWNVNDEYEARYFLNRNEKILNSCGGSWDYPLNIENLLSRHDLKQKVVDTLKKDLSSFNSIDFLGPKNYLKKRSVSALQVSWGWKDPRNTFLLPLWLEIFPDAKILHIYRNGLDIASSLAVREEKRVNATVQEDKPDLVSMLDNQKEQFNNAGFPLFISKKIRENLSKLNPLDKYDDFRIQPVISLKKGFDLWTLYIERAFSAIEQVDNQSMSIKYEDFLLDAKNNLSKLSEFCGLDCDEKQLNETSSRVNSKRRYAFKNQKNLVDLYEDVKSNFWMEKLGYNSEMKATL